MNYIVESARSLFPKDLYETLVSKATEKQLLETLAYELTIAINSENAEAILNTLKAIISYDNSIKSVIKHVCLNHDKHRQFRSKARYQLYQELDIEEFKTFKPFEGIDRSSYGKTTIDHVRDAIYTEQVDLFKNLFIKFQLGKEPTENEMLLIYLTAIESGNNEIISYVKQTKYDFSKFFQMIKSSNESQKNANYSDLVYNSHNYHYIDYMLKNNHLDSIETVESTDSLIYHLLYGIKLNDCSFNALYDITSFEIEDLDDEFICECIEFNAINVLSSISYEFNEFNLLAAIKRASCQCLSIMLKAAPSKAITNKVKDALKARTEMYK